ncbi:MAG: c-type cytochrome [Flavihumibacter sp.]|nr:c-type cytochrome [Flavihumibacter sp.]
MQEMKLVICTLLLLFLQACNYANKEAKPLASYPYNGKQLYEERCKSCHNIYATENYLRGIQERISDKQLLYGFIRNPDSVIKSGQPYFTQLYEQWNRTNMTGNPDLSNEAIQSILDYIETATP